MRLFRTFIKVLLISLFYSNLAIEISWAQNNRDLPDTKNAVIAEGLELVYDSNYDEAIQLFRKLNTIDPESAEALFFEAFVLELIMDVYRSQAFDDSLNAVLDRAITKAEEAVKKNPTARNYMFLGGTFGIRGVRKGILGSWWGAARDGGKANSKFEEAIKIDSTLYDCYYGIGSYHYWKTKKLRKFFIGFFFPDHRERGINEIHLSIEKGIFARVPGQMALFRIYIEEKRYDDIFELSELVLAENPDHLFPRWYLGIALVRTEQWERARENYQKILDFLPRISFRGQEAMIEAWYYLALSYYHLGDYQKSKELLDKIPPFKGKVNQNLFYYENYIEQSEKLLKKIG